MRLYVSLLGAGYSAVMLCDSIKRDYFERDCYTVIGQAAIYLLRI